MNYTVFWGILGSRTYENYHSLCRHLCLGFIVLGLARCYILGLFACIHVLLHLPSSGKASCSFKPLSSTCTVGAYEMLRLVLHADTSITLILACATKPLLHMQVLT